MATYVLVGGAWIGGWAWNEVAEALRGEGHDVHPVTLTGLGERVHEAHPGVTLDTHIADVVDVLDREGLTDVVLVGHSYASFVVEGAADRRPERIGAVVYVDSAPMGDGVALLDLSPPDERAAVERVVEQQGDGWLLPFPGIEQLGQQASLAGLDDAALERLAAHATPQPFGTYTQPLALSGRAPRYRRGVVVCSDGGISVAQIRAALASGNPGMFAVYAGDDWRFDEIRTGHWPMLSAPADLAAVLGSYAADAGPGQAV
jgi:pimeloyl-ACP methyl ester carboxylesterase